MTYIKVDKVKPWYIHHIETSLVKKSCIKKIPVSSVAKLASVEQINSKPGNQTTQKQGSKARWGIMNKGQINL